LQAPSPVGLEAGSLTGLPARTPDGRLMHRAGVGGTEEGWACRVGRRQDLPVPLLKTEQLSTLSLLQGWVPQ
jgi:hypothetical protein